MRTRTSLPGFLVALVLYLVACGSPTPTVVATPTPTLGPIPTLATSEAQTYLETAFDFVKQNYALSKQVDWDSLQRFIFTYAAGARTPADTYAAIRVLLKSLNHPSAHTYFLEAEQATEFQSGQIEGFGFQAVVDSQGADVIVIVYPGGPAAQAGIQPGDTIITANGQAPPRPPIFAGDTLTLQLKRRNQGAPFTVALHAANTNPSGIPDGRRLPDGLGYLDIPIFLGASSSAAALHYAIQAQQIIQKIDTTFPCGWIVDLRRDWGGNLYPMLAAAGPILGNGQAGRFIRGDGTQIPWSYEDGQAIYGQQVIVQVPDPYHLQRPKPPVAVLTSPLTGSAGEAMLVSFLGRPATRTFGAPTVGAPSSPATKVMSDGALLAVVGALEADRTGHSYPEQPIAPDQAVTPNWTQIETNNDPTLQAAAAWLHTQPGCAA